MDEIKKPDGAAPHKRRHRGGRNRHKKPINGAVQNTPQPKASPRPQQAAGKRAAAPAAENSNEDIGLMLISRRPPAVKFASFAEYLASREQPQAETNPLITEEE